LKADAAAAPAVYRPRLNPVELQGTFPLPEAQLDRFLIRLALGYPSAADEQEVLRRYQVDEPLDDLQPVAGPDDVLAMQRAVRAVYTSPAIEAYVVAIARATRAHPEVELGLSPRGTLALRRAAQALAAIHEQRSCCLMTSRRMHPPCLDTPVDQQRRSAARPHSSRDRRRDPAKRPAPVEREARP
jgi:hypothetical protein